MLSFFKKDWEYHFSRVKATKASCEKYHFYDEHNKNLLLKWKDALTDADNYMEFEETRGCNSLTSDLKEKRLQFLKKERADFINAFNNHEKSNEKPSVIPIIAHSVFIRRN